MKAGDISHRPFFMALPRWQDVFNSGINAQALLNLMFFNYLGDNRGRGFVV
jgi:hypothetical protein